MNSLFRMAAAIGIIAAAVAAPAGPRWAELYRIGELTVVPDPSFGRGVDWEAMVFDGFQDIAVGPDGSIFVANSRRDNIQKFDPTGKLVLTFGKRGQGPGDLQTPGSPCILDGKILVVSEYALLHRISLFDLNGKFLKTLKTERPVYDVVPLRANRIAYLSLKSSQATGARAAGVGSFPMDFRVTVKDVATGVEREAWKGTGSSEFVRLAGGGSLSWGSSMKGAPFIAATAEGDLAVGFSSAARIEIFSPQGEPLRGFALEIPAVPVLPEAVVRFKTAVLRDMDEEGAGRPKSERDAVAKADLALFFSEVFPLYRDLRVDSDGNFLFFLWDDEFGRGPIRIAAYSPLGRPIARWELKPGDFDLSIDSRFRRLQFSSVGLIGLGPLKADPYVSPRLFRCRL